MGTLLKRLSNVRFSARTIKKLFAPDKQRLLLKRYSGSPTVGAPYFSEISPEDFSVRKPIYLCQFEDFKYVMGSCNGLICLDNTTDESLMWNPSTGETKIIRSKVLGGFSPRMAAHCFSGGFGYDYKSQDFKLIRFISTFRDYDSDSESESDSYMLDGHQAEVYSLKNNSWKSIDYPGYLVMRKHACEEGYGFWLAYSSADHFILGFNFCTDELACHPLPYIGKSFGGSLHLEFANFEGSLCVIVFPKLGNDKAFDLWLHDGKAWYKEMEFCVTGAERPLGFWGRILFLEGIDRGLMAYDIDTGKTEKLHIYDYPEKMQLVPYVESDMSIMGFRGESDSKNRVKV